MNKILKRSMIILSVLMSMVVAGLLYVNLHPVFGGSPNGATLDRMKQSPQFRNGKFENLEPTPVMLENASMFQTMKEWIKGPENGRPDSVVTKTFDREAFMKVDDNNFNITWFGHSTVLINTGHHVILTDPVFSSSASPLPFTNRSFTYTNPVGIEDLPPIDILLISHDHYDHLDRTTIKKLDAGVKDYYVPLGVDAHLIRWGIKPSKIHTADWWDELRPDETLTLAATPARHFSGRSFTRNTTLWCSWVIQTGEGNIYFGADSGYGKHFKMIGEKYGPFALNMIECGQYNKNWALIHAMPEQSVQAHIDLSGEQMMCIHWSKFQLSLHPWTEPIERARVESARLKVPLFEPIIGEVYPLAYKKQENSIN